MPVRNVTPRDAVSQTVKRHACAMERKAPLARYDDALRTSKIL